MDEKLFNAFSRIDDDIIEDAADNKESEKKSFYIKKRVTVACAALLSAVLIIGVLFAAGIIVPKVGSISVNRMVKLAGMDKLSEMDGGTRSYNTVVVSSPEFLDINPIPDDEYVPVYKIVERKGRTTKNDEKDFRNYSDRIYSDLCGALGIEETALSEIFHFDSEYGFDRFIKNGEYTFDFSLEDGWMCTNFRFDLDGLYTGDIITLNGIDVVFDQSLSDEEIIENMEPLRKVLCSVMGVNLTDTVIERKFSTGNACIGAEWVFVYFIDSSKVSGGSTRWISGEKCIVLTFNNSPASYRRIEPSEIITDVTITFYYDSSYSCRKTAEVRRISLSEAEELLYKGYVFGVHACPLCMAMQPEVDFHGYEYVSFEYINGVPFYVFYKRLDDANNGNQVYAETYVPAIKVYGLDEYFKNQKKYH